VGGRGGRVVGAAKNGVVEGGLRGGAGKGVWTALDKVLAGRYAQVVALDYPKIEIPTSNGGMGKKKKLPSRRRERGVL